MLFRSSGGRARRGERGGVVIALVLLLVFSFGFFIFYFLFFFFYWMGAPFFRRWCDCSGGGYSVRWGQFGFASILFTSLLSLLLGDYALNVSIGCEK